MIVAYTLDELEDMETLCVGQADNLKFDNGRFRVWLSRMTIEDGMDYNNQVTVEKCKDGCWSTIGEYEAINA